MDKDLIACIMAVVFCVTLWFIYGMTALMQPDGTTSCVRAGGEWVQSHSSINSYCRKIVKKEGP